MGTGNALRATETFTLIQLEEERQKLKKKELLKHFGSINKIREANIEEIAKIKGINLELAKTIKNKLK